MAKVIPGRFAAEMHVPAVGTRETSRRRMGGDNNPAVPTPTNPE
ncbi:hypothetical protein [Paenibacillus macquariensis]|nr:hypothetical protein [Paenibacillus macquariensis]MEC0089504.1 hypothetical protein [Paenibacillus macquariensis]